MMDISYAVSQITEFFCYLVHAALIGAAWHRAGQARRRRRAEAALRAEATRGLADIEQYLQTRSAHAPSPKPDTGYRKRRQPLPA